MRHLSRQDVQLTLQYVPLLLAVRWSLWFTPFARLHPQWRARVQSELERAASPEIGPFSDSPTPVERVLINEIWDCAHAVRRAARLVPRGSCLTQAMALQLILARRGQPCFVRIGVDRKNLASPASNGASDEAKIASEAATESRGRFEAHAWVEWQDRVILGGDVSRWKPLTIFAPTSATSETPAKGQLT